MGKIGKDYDTWKTFEGLSRLGFANADYNFSLTRRLGKIAMPGQVPGTASHKFCT